eukprot:731516-Rhodomonas_salina.3
MRARDADMEGGVGQQSRGSTQCLSAWMRVCENEGALPVLLVVRVREGAFGGKVHSDRTRARSPPICALRCSHGAHPDVLERSADADREGWDSAVTKVESFNNFVLVFSTEPGCHVRGCLALALEMLAAVQPVRRPDGAPTFLKIGVSAGPFTARIIGLQSPRFLPRALLADVAVAS